MKMPVSMDHAMRPSSRHRLWLMVFVLLLATALRFYGLSQMAYSLHSDEAYYGLDALSLLEQPRLPLYFPANTGREGLWMGILAPMLAGGGAHPFVMRLTAALIGILTVAAVYRLGRECVPRAALWMAFALAVLYWHVHLSHIAFRVITLLLVGALAWAAYFRALRLGRGWWQVGLWFGLTLYTYVAATVYVAYALVCLALLWLRRKKQGRGLALAILIIVLCALPLAYLKLSSPAESVLRAAASDPAQIEQNLLHWGQAWLGRGDASATHNLPHRPILDGVLAAFALLGIVSAGWQVRPRWLILWWLAWVVTALLPTILSTETPHFLRGAGLLLPLACLLGIGAQTLARGHLMTALVTGLFLLSAAFTVNDWSQWLTSHLADFGIRYDYRVNAGLAQIAAQNRSEQLIVMPGDEGFHPTAAFIAQGMGYDIYFYRWSDAHDCYLSPRQPYLILDLPIVLNSFAARVLPYVDHIETLASQADDYHVFGITPSLELAEAWQSAPTFGDRLQARVIAPTVESVQAGDTLTLYWALRVLAPLDRHDYRVLVHLQGDPTPYEGGDLFSTGDSPLCELAYDSVAQQPVTLVQRLTLMIPRDLPAGDYHIALGIYEPNTFHRLPVTPAENPHGYSVGWQFTVLE